MGLLTFAKNIKYLFRYNIKKIHKHYYELDTRLQQTDETIQYSIDFVKYEIDADLQRIRGYQVMNPQETLDKIINSTTSLCRFGDGEFLLAHGDAIPFQDAHPRLAARLLEILASDDENITIAIPKLYYSLLGMDIGLKQYKRKTYSVLQDFILPYLDRDKKYGLASVTMPYIAELISDRKELETYYEKLASMWRDKDIALICGDRVFGKIKHNIFDCAKSVEYIYGPSENAFNEYDDILARAKQIDKNKIVFIILGPTATVLAYDLAKCGYRAIDIGHIAKDYNAFRTELDICWENKCEFFKPD